MRRFTVASVVLGIVGLSGLALGENPPATCAGSETYRFTLQGSDNDGYTGSGGTVQVNGMPYQTIYVRVRTLMTVTSGQTQGWSFGVQHTNPWTQYYGGAVSIYGVTTSGTQTPTVQNGSPPDTNHLQIRSGFNGFTQGVSIDNDTGITLTPVTDFVTAKACFALTAPSYEGTYPIDIKFSHDIGNPPIDATVVQGGLGKAVCANN